MKLKKNCLILVSFHKPQALKTYIAEGNLVLQFKKKYSEKYI